ncbi:transporter [Candidatus Methylospira mobilis]|uniref:Transporter n=1 Tax=Candidatus Methylospira mobilis TaxID=1808979 RepID=A0A5Q0BHW3_9GAMM|nr:transporter [Candidatus Methylospira mobilis]
MAPKLSARNILKGTANVITNGVVDTEVIVFIELSPGVEIVSIITKSSAENIGLTIGGSAYAIINASDVIVAVDG